MSEVALSYLSEVGSILNGIDSVSFDGQTVLMKASQVRGHGGIGIVQALLVAGADVNMKDNQGWTALMTASFYGHGGIVDALLAAGADINISDVYGQTALYCAVVKNRRCVARLLMEGADDTIIDYNNETAFQVAVRLNRTQPTRQYMTYAVRDAWEGMKGRLCESKLKIILSSVLIATNNQQTAPVIDNPTSPLTNFFHKDGSLNVLESVLRHLCGPVLWIQGLHQEI